MILPALNYSLMVELTTNIEELVFMRIKSATVTHKGSAIGGLADPVQKDYSSQLNNEIDRHTIDFGNITVGYHTIYDSLAILPMITGSHIKKISSEIPPLGFLR